MTWGSLVPPHLLPTHCASGSKEVGLTDRTVWVLFNRLFCLITPPPQKKPSNMNKSRPSLMKAVHFFSFSKGLASSSDKKPKHFHPGTVPPHCLLHRSCKISYKPADLYHPEFSLRRFYRIFGRCLGKCTENAGFLHNTAFF